MIHSKLNRLTFVFVFCCLSLNFLPLPTTKADSLSPAPSANRNKNNYSAYDASAVKSYLYQEDGNLVRVEFIDGKLLIEHYDDSFALLSSQTIPIDEGFDRWGGFYSGETYHFVIVGKSNPTEDDSTEVMRIIKYNKNWERLDQSGLFGANTFIPFDFGSLRCDEYGGMLYIHTCHSMYQSEDGLNHQANMMIPLRQEDMEIMDAQYTVSYSARGYVSHSFNQFVLADSEGRLITLNHGDMYPRAAILIQYPLPAGEDRLFSEDILGFAESFYLCEFPMGSIYQKTGASVGGLAETENCYIAVWNNDGNGGNDDSLPRNIYLAATSKNDFSADGTTTHQLTSYAPDTNSAGTPVLASCGTDGGYVLWDVQKISGSSAKTSVGKISYAAYDADGNVSSPVTTDGMLSDCQPIFYNGKIVWYVTDQSVPVFYVLDDSGLTAIRTSYADVEEGSWYSEAVRYVSQKGWILADGNAFKPDQNADRGTLVYALYQMENSPEPKNSAAFCDVPDYLQPAVFWAAENGVVNGISDDTFAPYDPITREQLAALLFRYAERKGYDVSAAARLDQYTDAPQISEYAFEAMSWANAAGLITGNSDGTLNPKGNATRAEVSTILMRFYENGN